MKCHAEKVFIDIRDLGQEESGSRRAIKVSISGVFWVNPHADWSTSNQPCLLDVEREGGYRLRPRFWMILNKLTHSCLYSSGAMQVSATYNSPPVADTPSSAAAEMNPLVMAC